MSRKSEHERFKGHMTKAKAAMVFLAGLLSGALLVDLLCIDAMRGYLRNYVAARRIQEERAAASARCNGDALHEILHRWLAAEETQKVERHMRDDDVGVLSPLAMALLYRMTKHDGSDEPSAVLEAVFRAKFADALSRGGYAKSADATWTAIREHNLSEARLRKVVDEQLKIECSLFGTRSSVRPGSQQ